MAGAHLLVGFFDLLFTYRYAADNLLSQLIILNFFSQLSSEDLLSQPCRLQLRFIIIFAREKINDALKLHQPQPAMH